MAFTDPTDGTRVIQWAGEPLKLAITAAVKSGDLLTESGGLADANAATPAPALYIAATAGASGDTITVFRSALISGFSGGAKGTKLFLSDTAGAYTDVASTTQRQPVGFMLSATEAFIQPERAVERATAVRAGLGATAGDYTVFFIAPQRLRVTSIRAAHTTAGTDLGAVTLTVEKLTGTQAPGAGADLLGATKIDLKAAINTVQSPALTATATDLVLDVGNRLAAKLAGTPTAVAGVCLVVELEPA